MKKIVWPLLVLPLLSGLAQGAERPLRILIVNDDGCDSVGTTSLQEKLSARGYEVWLVAPATNQSGIGSAITFKPNKIFEVKKSADKRYCFPGTPADAVDFGLWGVLKNTPPDLVISGVNDGPNTGAAQLNSGTVSAAARAVRYGFPAIAASIGYIFSEEEMNAKWPSTHRYWPDSVDYVATLVDVLAKHRQPGKPLLPAGSGLSINYPPLAKQAIHGVKMIGNEVHPQPQIAYELLADGRAQQKMNASAMQPGTADTDSGWLNKGYITWTVFDGDWNAPKYAQAYQSLLNEK